MKALLELFLPVALLAVFPMKGVAFLGMALKAVLLMGSIGGFLFVLSFLYFFSTVRLLSGW